MNEDEIEWMRDQFQNGEPVASRAGDRIASAAHEWQDSFECLSFYRAQEPFQGWWNPSPGQLLHDPKKPVNPEGARWWVPSDFVPGWGQQGRTA